MSIQLVRGRVPKIPTTRAFEHPIDTDIANVHDSTANTAVSAEFAGLIGRGTVH